ncbi:MAG: PepSY-associated TM helix domain-containing protein [Sphingomicrobium sp.]
MKLLSFLHRWSGGLIGLLLAVLGLSGTILMWKAVWISLPGAGSPVVENVQALGRIAERAAAAGATRITFASEEIGLHQVSRGGGAGAYLGQDGATVTSWSSQWERPELWIFDLHHHLFAGETGELVAGWAGVFGILFVVTGTILWLRSRSKWRPRLLPRKFQPGPVVSHHRDLGILIAPLLLVTFLTGTGMLFKQAAGTVLSPFGKLEARAEPPRVEPSTGPAPVAAMLVQAKARFPDAALRRLAMPGKAGQPWSVTMRQPFEWSANGRTRLMFDGSGKLIKIDDPAAGSRAAAIYEKFLPLHSAGVGGLAWRLVMSLSGLGLTILGALATWSFWFRKAKKRHRPEIARAGLEVAAAA